VTLTGALAIAMRRSMGRLRQRPSREYPDDPDTPDTDQAHELASAR